MLTVLTTMIQMNRNVSFEPIFILVVDLIYYFTTYNLLFRVIEFLKEVLILVGNNKNYFG